MAVDHKRLDMVEVLVQHGARVESVPLVDVLGTWDRPLMQFFLDRGADVVTGDPFMLAFCDRVQTCLRAFVRRRTPSSPMRSRRDIRTLSPLVLCCSSGREDRITTGMTSAHSCLTFPTKESAMLNRLLRLWRRFCEWVMPGSTVPQHHETYPQPYQPSNLHGRHR